MNFVNYIRQLIGFGGDDTATRPSYKRDRLDEDLREDEEAPAFKRLKQLSRTRFPDVLTMSECERGERPNSKVRYVPIQVESGHPSTSTPNTSSEQPSRVRSIPVRLVDVSGIGTEEIRRPRIHTPLKPVAHAVINDDDDDDDNDVTWVETTKPQPQSQKSTKQQKIFINLDDEDDENDDQDNYIFVKKVASPKPPKPYKFFVTKNNETSRRDEGTQYYKLMPQSKLERNVLSPRSTSKFKAPPGISKGYKRLTTPVPKWMQPLQPLSTSNKSQARNNYLNLNGNARSAISEVFNLNEKRNYQELIRRVAASSKPFSLNKTDEVINLADDAASFRSTIRSQKKSLEEIKSLERGLKADRDSESTREYDPVTVASINSSDSEPEIIPSGSSTSSSVRITPINTLRDSFKDRAILSEDWLSKLESKYKKKKEVTQEKLKDARRESNIIHKVNYEQKLALLEHKLKHELSIPESLIEEVQPTVELPELTPEQEKLVNRALGPGPPGQLLVEKFNLRITRRDLQTLAGLNWLNDEVINFYMNLLMQRSEERPDLPKVYAANTFFYPKLMQSGQAGLKRWTRKVDIFAHDLMVIPVHLGVHWCVCLVDLKGKVVQYLDSMGGNNPKCLTGVLQYLRDEHQDKKASPLDHTTWKTECLSKNIPQQMNGSDCGMFSCTFAEFAARSAPFSFSQQHMPYLRKKMALEILQGKLLL